MACRCAKPSLFLDKLCWNHFSKSTKMSALNNFVYFLQIYLSSQASFKILPINKLIDFSTIDVILYIVDITMNFLQWNHLCRTWKNAFFDTIKIQHTWVIQEFIIFSLIFFLCWEIEYWHCKYTREIEKEHYIACFVWSCIFSIVYKIYP